MVFVGSRNAHSRSLWVADCCGGTSWLRCGYGGHRRLSLLTRPSVKDGTYMTTPIVEINLKDAMVLQRNIMISLPEMGMASNILVSGNGRESRFVQEISEKFWKRVKREKKSLLC